MTTTTAMATTMAKRTVNDLQSRIISYWDGRADTYSNGVVDELTDGRRGIWMRELIENGREAFALASARACCASALDVGCGPGFFTSLLAEAGCTVDAVDSSAEMLAHACANVSGEVPSADVTYWHADLHDLPFDDGTFDLIVSRNVTWLMRDPVAAYAEWLRVLRPGGVMLVFDANWYRYLCDSSLDAARRADQDGKRVEGWADDAQATLDQERRCELIAAELPFTSVLRPAWDVRALASLGSRSVMADEDVWQRVWTTGEKAFYRTSPLFMVKAVK